MTIDQADRILGSGNQYFDYLQGRVMKIDLSHDEIDTRLFDRDNGRDAAAKAIAGITKK
jgi:hypothetical protein